MLILKLFISIITFPIGIIYTILNRNNITPNIGYYILSPFVWILIQSFKR